MKLTDCLLIAVIVSCISYVVSGQIVCLSCKGARTPTDCGVVEICGNYSQCYLDMIVENAGAIYYNSGCRDVQKCTGSGRRRGAGRNVTSLAVSNVQTNLPPISPFLNTSYTGISKPEHSDKAEKYKRNLACATCCNYKNFCNDNGCGQTGFPSTRGPICYACDQQIAIDDCREIKVCGRDEICYIEEITLASDKIFHTTCMSKTKCQDQNIIMQKSHVSLVGRTLEHDKHLGNRDQTLLADLDDDARGRRSTSAKGCCTGDLCNTILPRDGNWGPWTSWGACSSSCGFNGSRQRFRNCEFPAASHGGLPCIGSATETDITCANKSCDKQMICLSCTASVHPRTCNYVETCGPNSVCFVEEYVTHAGEIRFKTGCRDRLQCHNGIRKTKRFMVNGDYLSCMECCHGDLCNSHGCGEPGYPSLRGPICYSCDQQKDPSHCGKIDVCKNGQQCGLIQHQFVDTVYQTKCLDPASCKSDNINNPDYPKCCSKSLCVSQIGTTPKPNDLSSPTSVTKPTVHSGFTTAPITKSTVHSGFTTAPITKSTVHSGFTTAPITKSTVHSGFTTAPITKSTVHSGFTTAPITKSTVHSGFTTAPITKSTVHSGFTTTPITKSTVHSGFTTAPITKPTITSTSQIVQVGQWTQWTPWSACLETDPNVQGTKERMRQCVDPAHQHPEVCIHSHTIKDWTYCRGGQPDVCTPPIITDIKIIKGTWGLGEYVVVQCFVKGDPTPSVQWQRHTDGVQIYANDSSKIAIGPIENRHEGDYVCEAFNKCKQSVSKVFSTDTLPKSP